MSFDGAAFEISSRQFTYRNPDVRFWADPSEVLGRVEAEHQLDAFIENVLKQLDGAHLVGTSAALRWARVRESRANPEEVVFCEAAGALGHDPYAIDPHAASIISSAAELFAGEALNEFLAGARDNSTERLIDWVRQVERWPRYRSLIPDLSAVAKIAASVALEVEGERSWALGYRRARAARAALGLGAADRLRSYKTVAEKFGAGRQYKLAPRIGGIRALRSDQDNGVHIYLRNHGNAPDAKSGETFAFTRAVGDVVCFPDQSRAPVNELHDAYRQAAGRAFAAEFLAPIHEIESMRADGRDIQSIADEFSISPAVIDRQLENAERIAEACS